MAKAPRAKAVRISSKPKPKKEDGSLEFAKGLTLDKDFGASVFDHPQESIADAIILLGPKASLDEIARVSGFELSVVQRLVRDRKFIEFVQRRHTEKQFNSFRTHEQVSRAIREQFAILETDDQRDLLADMHPQDRLKYMLDLAKLERYRAQTAVDLALRSEAGGDEARGANPREMLYKLLKSDIGKEYLKERIRQKKLKAKQENDPEPQEGTGGV